MGPIKKCQTGRRRECRTDCFDFFFLGNKHKIRNKTQDEENRHSNLHDLPVKCRKDQTTLGVKYLQI